MNLLDKEFLLVDKPAGLSSFAVVARIRRILTEQMKEDYAKRGLQAPKRAKVGHAGTLDPFATGLLICLLGKGTKRAGEFLKKDKRYQATICLGKVSTTGDPEGEISECRCSDKQQLVRHRLRFGPSLRAKLVKTLPSSLECLPSSVYSSQKLPSLDEVRAVVSQFQGKIRQKVPAYSAVKIDGRRAYDLARKGIEVEMPEREVEIYEISIVDYKWPYLRIDCKVSSGTYIRALGEDIGKALNVGGYLTELRRTEIGDFKVEDAVTLEELGITS